MKNLQKDLLTAGSRLGIKVVAPYELEIVPGRKVLFDAWLPELGDRNGMLVIEDSSKIKDILDDVADAGYGLSSYGDSEESQFELRGFIEMFSDWGWSSSEPRPLWMIPPEVLDEWERLVDLEDLAE